MCQLHEALRGRFPPAEGFSMVCVCVWNLHTENVKAKQCCALNLINGLHLYGSFLASLWYPKAPTVPQQHWYCEDRTQKHLDVYVFCNPFMFMNLCLCCKHFPLNCVTHSILPTTQDSYLSVFPSLFINIHVYMYKHIHIHKFRASLRW